MIPVKKYIYYFWKKGTEKANQQLIDKHIKTSLALFHNCESRKPDQQIKQEMRALQKYWGCRATQYYEYGMYRSDYRATMDEMNEFIPYYFLPFVFFPRVNPVYYKISDEKNIANAFFDYYQIPRTHTLFKYHGGRFYNGYEEVISDTQAFESLELPDLKTIFIKPAHGMQGMGIQRFIKEGNNFVNDEGRKFDTRFLQGLNDVLYLIEKGMEQHPLLSEIYPHALNTIRILTKTEGQEVKLILAFLRMGTGGDHIDNSSKSIAVKINLDSGRLEEFAISNYLKKLSKHPDTGFVFKNTALPHWDVIMEAIPVMARKFAFIKFIGWDIAITPDGFRVIEINRSPALKKAQLLHGGLKSKLEITNPKDWYYNTNYNMEEL